MNDDLAEAIRASAGRLGIDPVDLGTAISYETAGTFDPWKAGPRTQWGQHRGLIQWGEPQRQKYGVFQGMPNADQMKAVERYLIDAGVKPGMGLLDVYSAINAGRVGRYGASDANNGGAPGTVRDKVERQMADHRAKAARMLGGETPAPIAQAFTSAPAPALGDGMPAAPVQAATVDPGALAAAFMPEQPGQDRRTADRAKREAVLNSVASLFR